MFTFGSPPVFLTGQVGDVEELDTDSTPKAEQADVSHPYHCPVLASFGLPYDMVYGYLQPWVSADT